MPAPRIPGTLLLLLMLIPLEGCHSFRPLTKELPAAWSEGAEARFIRVELQHGDRIELMRASMDEEAVRGQRLWRGGEEEPEHVRVPLPMVVSIEERYFSWKKFALVTGTIVAGLGGALAYALGQAF